MPIFEYQCQNCSTIFEILHMGTSSREEIVCPSCQSTEYKRLISASNIGGHSHGHASAEMPACEYARSGACTHDCEFQSND